MILLGSPRRCDGAMDKNFGDGPHLQGVVCDDGEGVS